MLLGHDLIHNDTTGCRDLDLALRSGDLQQSKNREESHLKIEGKILAREKTIRFWIDGCPYMIGTGCNFMLNFLSCANLEALKFSNTLGLSYNDFQFYRDFVKQCF